MIIDKCNNWKTYKYGPFWETVFDFLLSLSPDAKEQKYNILGDEIFALVMSYETQSPEAAVLEAHQKYVDVQTVLVGCEAIEWHNKDSLQINVPYDKAKDVELYKRRLPGQTRVDVYPGNFVTLFPQDAHMPSLMIGGKTERIKKVVVKVSIDLFDLG